MPAQTSQIPVETLALEQLGEEIAARAQVLAGKLQRQVRQVDARRLVGNLDTRQIGGHIGQHKVHGPLAGLALQQGQDRVLAEVAAA